MFEEVYIYTLIQHRFLVPAQAINEKSKKGPLTSMYTFNRQLSPSSDILQVACLHWSPVLAARARLSQLVFSVAKYLSLWVSSSRNKHTPFTLFWASSVEIDRGLCASRFSFFFRGAGLRGVSRIRLSEWGEYEIPFAEQQQSCLIRIAQQICRILLHFQIGQRTTDPTHLPSVRAE